VVQVAHNIVGTVHLSTWATGEVRATHLGYRFAEDSNVMVGSGLSADNVFGEELSILAEPTPRIWFHFRVSRGFCSLFERGKSGRASQLPLHSLNVQP
jgi:hypothetical protein